MCTIVTNKQHDDSELNSPQCCATFNFLVSFIAAAGSAAVLGSGLKIKKPPFLK
jgi:hypothetical protein